MRIPTLVQAKKLVVSLMERLDVAELEMPMSNTSLGYHSIRGIEGRIQYDEFLLMISKDPLTALMNVTSNTGVLWEHPICIICLQADPASAVQRLLSIVSGVNLAELKVAPSLWPAVQDGAVDVHRSPVFFCRPKTMDLASLCGLAGHLPLRGIRDLYIDAPNLLRLAPRKASTAADFPAICEQLRSLARANHMVIIGAHAPTLKLGDAVQFADHAIRIEEFDDTARFGVLRAGQAKPEFILARRYPCGRYGNLYRMPWDSSTGKRFAAARKG